MDSSLADSNPYGRKESDTTEATEHACVHVCMYVCMYAIKPALSTRENKSQPQRHHDRGGK